MPTPIVPSAVCLLTIRATLAGQTILTTINISQRNPVPVPDYFTVGQNLCINEGTAAGQMVDLMAQATCNVLTFNEIIFQPIYPNRYAAVSEVIVGKTGVISSTCLPPNVAGTLTKGSINATRWGRGSIHLAGFPASAVNAGVWSNAQQLLMNNIAAHVLGGFKGNPGDPVWDAVLWNHKLPARTTVVNQCYAQETSRVERRRTVRVGI